MKDLLLGAVSHVMLKMVDVVGTGTQDGMVSDGQVVVVVVVVDRSDGGKAAKSIVCDYLLIPENSALQLLFFAFRHNQEAREATFLAVVGQRHVITPTSRHAQILHAKDGLMLAER